MVPKASEDHLELTEFLGNRVNGVHLVILVPLVDMDNTETMVKLVILEKWVFQAVMVLQAILVHLALLDVLVLMVRLDFLGILAIEVNLATLGLDLRVPLVKKAIVVKLAFKAKKVDLVHPDLSDQWGLLVTEVPMG